jgi:hypothetical protein
MICYYILQSNDCKDTKRVPVLSVWRWEYRPCVTEGCNTVDAHCDHQDCCIGVVSWYPKRPTLPKIFLTIFFLFILNLTLKVSSDCYQLPLPEDHCSKTKLESSLQVSSNDVDAVVVEFQLRCFFFDNGEDNGTFDKEVVVAWWFFLCIF